MELFRQESQCPVDLYESEGRRPSTGQSHEAGPPFLKVGAPNPEARPSRFGIGHCREEWVTDGSAEEGGPGTPSEALGGPKTGQGFVAALPDVGHHARLRPPDIYTRTTPGCRNQIGAGDAIGWRIG